MTDLWPWATLAVLGAFHGINPAMGWLFAVGLALQQGRRAAVCQALIPIALGHAASIAAVAATAWMARALVDPRPLRLTAAGVLVAFGTYRLVRGSRHRTRVGMQVGFRDLALWSFLAATGHGAGLMVVPALLGLPRVGGAPVVSNPHLAIGGAVGSSIGLAVGAAAVHTFAMLAAAGSVAIIVFDRVGLAILRRGWINFDLLWALALLGAGALMLVL